MTKAIIFDLDGTLLNTLDSIAYYANHTLVKYGFEPIETERYKILTGQGARNLMTGMLRDRNCDDKELLEKMLYDYNKTYDDNFLYLTRPYDGVVEMLKKVREKGIKTAVISNKPHSTTAQVVEATLGGLLDIVFGNREGVPLKPDPTAILEIIDMLGIAKEDILYVGDTGTDMMAGARAGLHTVGCTWGFRDRAELENYNACSIIDNPMEILDLIKE